MDNLCKYFEKENYKINYLELSTSVQNFVETHMHEIAFFKYISS